MLAVKFNGLAEAGNGSIVIVLAIAEDCAEVYTRF
jgi:hypothetical protein